jgi:hypothetical protein
MKVSRGVLLVLGVEGEGRGVLGGSEGGVEVGEGRELVAFVGGVRGLLVLVGGGADDGERGVTAVSSRRRRG